MAILLNPLTKQSRAVPEKLVALKSCSNCGYSDNIIPKEGSNYILCKRNPPNIDGIFPEVKNDEYCGEWRSEVGRLAINKLKRNVTFGHDTPVILDDLDEPLFNKMQEDLKKTKLD